MMPRVEANTLLKGAVVEAEAIAYFSRLGYVVSIPFTTTGYDLVIERDGVFQRVQCKYAGRRHAQSGYIVHLTKWVKRTARFSTNFDLLYCLTPLGDTYLVRIDQIRGHTFAMSRKYLVPPHPAA